MDKPIHFIHMHTYIHILMEEKGGYIVQLQWFKFPHYYILL